MGLYSIDCINCGAPTIWFSGDHATQMCVKCREETKGFVIGEVINLPDDVIGFHNENVCVSGYELTVTGRDEETKTITLD